MKRESATRQFGPCSDGTKEGHAPESTHSELVESQKIVNSNAERGEEGRRKQLAKRDQTRRQILNSLGKSGVEELGVLVQSSTTEQST